MTNSDGKVDAAFTALPLAEVADAALDRARRGGASHAEFRVERSRTWHGRARDRVLLGASGDDTVGLSVRVLREGTWGFAASTDLDSDSAARAATEALEVAAASTPLNKERVELAAEPAHNGIWVSSYEINPFDLAVTDRTDLLLEWTGILLESPVVAHADAGLICVQENKFYADTSGTSTTQQRVRVHPTATAVGIDPASGSFETMRTTAPPAGRGWEYALGTGWDWARELGEMPEMLAEKLGASSVQPGLYDVVIDPTNLFLTIHESIGHATELDRALGYEAAYAGTSFATIDKLGSLKYGSAVMHVTGDRTAEHGLATVGYDDEGVEAQSWDLIRDGILVGFQLNRAMAAREGFDRSNGCAFADSPSHVPLQRMANVSLQPGAGGPTTSDLIAAMGDGLYIVGDKSWSIDMQRYNFQFTGQRFYRVRNGRLAGQVRDAAYQGVTTEFWGSMEAVGGESTYLLGGAFNCGKGQPGQIAPVSHGCPSAWFRQVRILNAQHEAGR
ncbi:MAG TPA: TldD/PmbA family protein [Acidimicrobiales bacterium]|nr:TldD/PmbA family protein [Acidimicrobiales bacterium]